MLRGALPDWIFLSTPSARRATFAMLRGALPDWIFLSTPSARRATRWMLKTHFALCISIHALREEGDGMGTVGLATSLPFLSTPSARRATLH